MGAHNRSPDKWDICQWFPRLTFQSLSCGAQKAKLRQLVPETLNQGCTGTQGGGDGVRPPAKPRGGWGGNPTHPLGSHSMQAPATPSVTRGIAPAPPRLPSPPPSFSLAAFDRGGATIQSGRGVAPVIPDLVSPAVCPPRPWSPAPPIVPLLH